jgi:hypothetical protein
VAANAQPVAVQLANDLFLDGTGKFTKNLPTGSLVATPAGGLLDLPDQLKGFLAGKELTAVREGGIVSTVADVLNIGKEARELAKDLFSIATSMATVIGYAQAAVRLLEALGVFGPDPTQAALARIEKRVNELFNLSFGAVQDVKIVAVQSELSKVRAARDQMVDYLKFPYPQSQVQRQNLDLALTGLRTARHQILSQNVHAMPFRWSQYAGAHDLAANGWWMVKSGKSNSAATPVPDMRTLGDGAMRWDYRGVLAAVQEAVSVSLAFYKTIDPAFRTTGRFREEIADMAKDLRTFVQNMTACIQWTRDYDLVSDRYFMPLAHGYPVGAADVCSGASSIVARWNEGVVALPGGGLEPPLVLNINDVLERGKAERERAWFSVFASSPIPELLQLQRRLEELATPPTVSETLKISAVRSGSRTFKETVQYAVAPTLGCDGASFPADVYDVQRTWRVRTPVQPAFYAEQYAIPYRVYLESLSSGDPVSSPWAVVSRVELTGASGAATLPSARTYTWEVKKTTGIAFRPQRGAAIARLAGGTPPPQLLKAPGMWVRPLDVIDLEAWFSADAADNTGQLREPGWGSVTIDYEVRRSDGQLSITLRNRPGDGNFALVFLVIEETPGPTGTRHAPIRTAVEVSTVGREYHLGQEYFDHVEQCEARLAEILDYLSHYVRVQPVGPPIPPWDPYRFRDIEQYVAAVYSLQPRLVPRQLMTRRALQRVRTMQLPPDVMRLSSTV